MGDMADMIEEMCWAFDEPMDITCKYCGEDYLHWEDTEKGWRLYNEHDEPHECPHPPYMENWKP
jgi:hypothetical protein